MNCHVIINDFEIGRRILYVLDEKDFIRQKRIWYDTDDLLISMNNDLFAGKIRWCDLEIKHFHVMIVNMLRILGNLDDDARGDKTNPLVIRLTFFLCGLISLMQNKTDSIIELMKINRISPNDVLYDYSATMDVKVISSPHSNLKIVVDNDDDDD